jgi:hypothetical protein
MALSSTVAAAQSLQAPSLTHVAKGTALLSLITVHAEQAMIQPPGQEITGERLNKLSVQLSGMT